MPRRIVELDQEKHILGNLCKRNHEWNETGKSARYKHNGLCIECKRESHTRRFGSDSEYTSRKKSQNQCAAKRRVSTDSGRKRMVQLQIEHRSRKLQVDPYFALVNRLRARVRRAFSYYAKRGKFLKSKEYGIDYEAIIKHIGPCPGNQKDYHVDHIIPLSMFDFNDLEQIKKAFAPENHQWLKAEQNLVKGNRYIG